MNEQNGNRVAVLVDYENLVIEYRKKFGKAEVIDWADVIDFSRQFGKVLVKKAYADFRGELPDRDNLMRLGFDPVTVPKKQGKNGVDVKIAVDALDILVVKDTKIDTLVIASGDGDFAPLVNYLKDFGKTVIGIGIHGSIAEFLRCACHDFRCLSKGRRLGDVAPEPLPPDVQPAAVKAAPPPDAPQAALPVPPMAGSDAERHLADYLQILHRSGIPLTPCGNRESVIRACYQVLNGNGGEPVGALGEKIAAQMGETEPPIDLCVSETIEQMVRANCLRLERATGDHAPESSEDWIARLMLGIQKPSALMAIIDRFIIETLMEGTGSGDLDPEALSVVLYGDARNPEHLSMTRRRLEQATKQAGLTCRKETN